MCLSMICTLKFRLLNLICPWSALCRCIVWYRLILSVFGLHFYFAWQLSCIKNPLLQLKMNSKYSFEQKIHNIQNICPSSRHLLPLIFIRKMSSSYIKELLLCCTYDFIFFKPSFCLFICLAVYLLPYFLLITSLL